MVRILLTSFLFSQISSLHAMESHRILGAVVEEFDQKNMRAITSRDDIKQGEIIAVYYKSRKDGSEWRYAQITSYVRDSYHFVGLVAFQPQNVLKARAVDFEKDVRKLPSREDCCVSEHAQQKSAGQRLCDLLQLLHCCLRPLR